jgi:hypothetical protein
MRYLISTAIAAALIVTLPACKQQPAAEQNQADATADAASVAALNGTWKVDLASLKFGGKPDEVLVKDGSYNCATCIPPLTVAADGQFHAVTDRPYFDSMSVKVVDDKTIEIHRKMGDKEVSSLIEQVSADGNTLTYKFKDMTTPDAPTVEGSSTATRVGPAPAGAHAVSGQWQTDKIGDYSEAALDIVFQVDGDTVTSTSQGQTYVATLGGPAVAIKGDTGGTTVKVERAGHGIKETYSRGGKDVGIASITPNADGKSFSYSSTDPRDGATVSFTANKK